jgi:protein SCO1/2
LRGRRATVSVSADGTEGPAASLSVADRAAALSEGAPRIPRRAVYIAFVAAFLLAGLGILGEDFFSSVGLNPVPAQSSPIVAPTTLPTGPPQLNAPLAAFMGIVRVAPAPAPAFSLVDESGAAVSLASERGKIVVLSFFDSTCTDICRVLEAELAQADVDLGKASSAVVFLTVNTDPRQTSVSTTTAAVVQAHSSHLTNWHLLGGSLKILDAVWRAYRITVNVSQPTGLVAHTDTLYFISPDGQLRFQAAPYADESTAGAFSLSPAAIARWGTGIAAYSDGLLRHSR